MKETNGPGNDWAINWLYPGNLFQIKTKKGRLESVNVLGNKTIILGNDAAHVGVPCPAQSLNSSGVARLTE